MNDCAFETARLRVADWYVLAGGPSHAFSLVGAVRTLLTSEVTAQLPAEWQGAYSERRALDWIRDRDAEGTPLLVVSRRTGRPVGLLLLHEAKTAAGDGPEVRLGYLIAEAEWGRGLASELVGGFVTWARQRDVGSIIAGVSASNPASIRVLEKSGFVRAEEQPEGGSELFFTLER